MKNIRRRSVVKSKSHVAAVLFEAVEARCLFAAAPILGAELVLPGDTTPALSVGSQRNPSLAEGPNGVSLAVWQDTRSLGAYGEDIYAARIRADGSVIDVTPIPIAIYDHDQTNPKAAWNGTNWLVAWDTERADNLYENDINAVRVAPDGSVLDAQPILIGAHAPDPNSSDDIDPQGPHQVLANGSDWVVTYMRHNIENFGGIGVDWFGVEVLANGAVPNLEGVKIRETDQYSGEYGLHYSPVNGGQFLHVFGEDNGQLYITRLDSDLNLIAGSTRTTPAPAMNRVAVAGGPNGWIIASTFDQGGAQQVQARRVNASGNFVDTSPLPVTPVSSFGETFVDVTWNGIDWSVGYSLAQPGIDADTEIYVRRVSPTGTGAAAFASAQARVIAAPNHQGTPRLISSGNGGVKMLYLDTLSAKPGIAVAVISPTDQLLAQADASLAAPSQAGERLASDGSNFLLLFSSSNAYGSRVLAQRVTPQGTAIDAEPLEIVPASAQPAGYAAVYFNGRYVALFSADLGAGRMIYAREISTAGVVGAPVALMSTAAFQGFGLGNAAVNGDALILVGNSNEGSLHRSSRFMRVFNSSFAPVSDRIQIGTGYALGGDTEAVLGGWVLAWGNRPSHDAPRVAIHYAVVATDGRVIVNGTGITSAYPVNGTPTVVSNGGEAASEALIVYSQKRDPVTEQIQSDQALRARRVSASGPMIGDQITLIDVMGASPSQPAGTFDGTNYFLTWSDYRNTEYPQALRADVFATRVAVNGTVVDPDGFAIADSFREERYGDVAVAGGKVLFAYNSFRHEAPWGSYRMSVRGMSTSESSPLQAVSGVRYENDRDQALSIHFNKPLQGVDTSDLIITNSATGAIVPAGALRVQIIPTGTQPWTYRWVYQAGVLPNGSYTARLPAGSLTDLAGMPITTTLTTQFRVLAGDANNDGRINFDDYARIDYGFNNRLIGNSNGDFNYDGVINFDDYAIIDAAFNAQPPAPVRTPTRGPGGKSGTPGVGAIV